MSTEPTNSPGYETKDVNITKILLYGAGGIALLVVFVVLVYNWFSVAKEQAIYEAQLKPESAALRDLRAREAELLGSFAVIDEKAGTYRVPIDRAMEIIAEQAYKKRTK
ncbi:MAG: hypothetical protein R3F48_18085 [Candidatus Zixiibacteriota bacterium]